MSSSNSANPELVESETLVPPDQGDDDAYSQDVAVMKRVRWFDQLPEFDHQSSRLLVDQQLSLDRDRRHNLGFHRSGVVEGLEILYTGTGLSFKITPGHAIDPDGFSLLRSPASNVPPDRESDFSGSGLESGGSRYLCICPSLAKADKLVEQGKNGDYSTWWDRPRIVLVSATDLNDARKADKTRREKPRLLTPSELGANGTYQPSLKAVAAYNAVILARVTRNRDDTLEFDYSERQCSGTIVPNSGGMAGDHTPAALCFQPNSDGTGTNVFTGELTIAGKLTAKGGLELGGPVVGQVTFDEWVDFADSPTSDYEPVRLWRDPVSQQTYISGVVRNKQTLESGDTVLLQVPIGFRPAKTNVFRVPLFPMDGPGQIAKHVTLACLTLELRADGKFVVPGLDDSKKDGFAMIILSGVQWSSSG
jgi:hypothetical protein